MVTTTKKQQKTEYEQWLEEDEKLTQEFTDKINALFFAMLKNPTDKEIDTFRTLRDALIVSFLMDLFDVFKEQLKRSMNMGINIANEQLKRLKIDKIIKKSINDKKFNDMLKSVIESNLTTIAYVLDSIKVETDNIIRDIKSEVVESKKTFIEDLIKKMAEKALKDGIAHYYDRAGRSISIEDYLRRKLLDEITKMMRNAYFMQAKKYGVPYVRIVHLNIHPHCSLCEPFTNKILALDENEDGVMTLAEANQQGLFHPYCDDVPMNMVLEDSYEDEDIYIELNEDNKKRRAYNEKRGFKSFFG